MGIAQASKLLSLLWKVLADTRTEDVKYSLASLGFPAVRGGKGCVCFLAVPEYLLTYLLC